MNRSGVGWLWKVHKEGHRRAGWDIRFPNKEISCEEGMEGGLNGFVVVVVMSNEKWK